MKELDMKERAGVLYNHVEGAEDAKGELYLLTKLLRNNSDKVKAITPVQIVFFFFNDAAYFDFTKD